MGLFSWLRRKPSVNAEMEGSTTVVVSGRTRTAGVPYALPNDLEEMNRLDFQHYMFRQAFQGNYAAPISNPRSILDVGTGTGRWAREMAQLFPQADVIGLDINLPPADDAADSGLGPELRPPNYRFIAGNVLEGLPFPDGAFDFTHMRLLTAAIPHDRWPSVVQELVRVTKVGSWVESVEAPLPEHGGPAMEQLMDWIRAISLRRGVDVNDGATVSDLLQACGLANVYARMVPIPCGDYGGRVGKLMATDYLHGTRGVAGIFVSQGFTTPEELERIFAAAAAEMSSPQVRCIFPVRIAYGQRVR